MEVRVETTLLQLNGHCFLTANAILCCWVRAPQVLHPEQHRYVCTDEEQSCLSEAKPNADSKCFFCFEIESCYVTQVGYSQSSYLSLPSPGIIGMSHYAWLSKLDF
jgi:hypothetical protein